MAVGADEIVAAGSQPRPACQLDCSGVKIAWDLCRWLGYGIVASAVGEERR